MGTDLKIGEIYMVCLSNESEKLIYMGDSLIGGETKNVFLSVDTKEIRIYGPKENIVYESVNKHISFNEITNGLENHSEKRIYQGCLSLLESLNNQFLNYLEMMDVDQEDPEERWCGSLYNSEIVRELFLEGTSHSGGTSTGLKCRELGIDSSKAIYFLDKDLEEEEDFTDNNYPQPEKVISQREAYLRRNEIKVGDKFVWYGTEDDYITSGLLPRHYMVSSRPFDEKILTVYDVYVGENGYGKFVDYWLCEDENNTSKYNIIINGPDAFLMKRV